MSRLCILTTSPLTPQVLIGDVQPNQMCTMTCAPCARLTSSVVHPKRTRRRHGNADTTFCLLAMRLPQTRRNAAVAAYAAITAVLQLIESEPMSAALAEEVAAARRTERELLRLLEPQRGGRGFPKVKPLPALRMPKDPMYIMYVLIPDRFKELCGFTPPEFNDLLADVRDVLDKPRNTYYLFTEEQNTARRRRSFKYTAPERLFAFLCYMREYRPLRKFAAYHGLCFAACWYDFAWLKHELVKHPALTAEVLHRRLRHHQSRPQSRHPLPLWPLPPARR